MCIETFLNRQSLPLVHFVQEDDDPWKTQKLVFKGFEEKRYWVPIKKKEPAESEKRYYSQISVQTAHGREERVWVLNDDLFEKFTKTALEISKILINLPHLILNNLRSSSNVISSHLRSISPVEISLNAMYRMTALALNYLYQENWIRFSTKRPEGTTKKIILNKEAWDLIYQEDWHRIPPEELPKKLEAIKMPLQKEVWVTFQTGTEPVERAVISGNRRGYILFTKDTDPLISERRNSKFCLGIHDMQLRTVIICEEDPSNRKFPSREAELLSDLRDVPGIIQCDSTIFLHKVYLITEYMNLKDLERIFHRNPQLSLKKRLLLAKDIALGLSNLHERGIIHRDLTAANISLSDKGRLHAKIGNLESAIRAKELPFFKERIGTLECIPPEKMRFLDDRKEFDEGWITTSTPAADVWALGLLFFSLFHPIIGSKVQFQPTSQNLQQEEIIRELEKSEIDWRIQLCIHKMLDLNAEKRPSAKEIFEQLQQIEEESPENPEG